jgi:biofilm protein TabA
VGCGIDKYQCSFYLIQLVNNSHITLKSAIIDTPNQQLTEENMVLGHLNQTPFSLPEDVEKALHYLRNTEFTSLESGRYDIDGDNMFALVQDPITQSWDVGYPEFHAKYIDVQYLIEGEEVIGYLPTNSTLIPTINHLAEKDIAFVAQQMNETKLCLTAGMFAIFYPGELHRPCRTMHTDRQIKKVVIKIATKIAIKNP